jgi:Flp pilus assembly protein TadD
VPGRRHAGRVRPPSLQAFEQYVKGLLAEQPASQAAFLEAALKLDPATIAPGWRCGSADVAGDHAAALAPRGPCSARRRLAPRAVPAGVSLVSLSSTTRRSPCSRPAATRPRAAILNNLGVVQLRRAAPRTGKPTYFFTKAAEAAPDDPDILFNLGYAYALDRDPQGRSTGCARRCAAIPPTATRTSCSPRRSTRPAAPSRRPRARAGRAALDAVDAARTDRCRAASSACASDSTRAAAPHRPGHPNTAQRDQRDLAQFHLERGRPPVRGEQDREAMIELRRAVFLSPYEAEAHLLIGRIHLRGGRPREAVDALKISIWSRDTAAGARRARRRLPAAEGLPARRPKCRRRWRSIRLAEREGAAWRRSTREAS